MNIDFVKSFIEVADPERPTNDIINITPELADHLDGRCFIDLDMHERLEGFQFHKTNNGIIAEYCGTDGYGIAYIHDGSDDKFMEDKFGKHLIDNTYNGCTIYEVVFDRSLNLEIPVEAYEHIKHFVQQQLAIRNANREYIDAVRDIIIKNVQK